VTTYLQCRFHFRWPLWATRKHSLSADTPPPVVTLYPLLKPPPKPLLKSKSLAPTNCQRQRHACKQSARWLWVKRWPGDQKLD